MTTRVPGHGLQFEGRYFYLGRSSGSWSYTEVNYTRARCACGELSPLGLSVNARKRWHREHKASVLEGAQS